MTKQTITIIIIALTCLGLGYFAGFMGIGTIQSPENTYQAGWDAAKQRLAETGFAPMMEDIEITFVSGTIQEIKDNKIYLKIQPLTPLADPELDNRIIETDANTKIYKLVEKNQEEYQREMEEFDQKMREQMENPEAAGEPIMPPEIFIKEEANFSALEVG
ncbi:MAG: hypothetical protein U9P63_01235, partial [Patescibacteria group bacterium]|nr:hypothetical protein [Patescibacteria group bacterium]